MVRKRIVFTAPGKAELLEDTVSLVDPHDVLVELAVSTVSSGTERANVSGEVNVSITKSSDKAVFPRYSGYSSSGTVIAAGSEVRNIRPGDRVALAWSTHSQYVCIHEKNVIVLPDDISFEEAALCHIGTFPLAAIRKCHLEIGESALVMGLGILGQMAVLQLRAAGAVPVIAADPIKEKRELALQLGADYALDPFAKNFAEQVKEITNGGVSIAIEVTGVGQGLDLALDCMKRFGRVALLGCTRHSDFTIDFYHKVHGPGITLVGAHTLARPETESHNGWWTVRDDMNAQLQLLMRKRLNYRQLVVETHSPEAAPEVYARLCTERNFPVVQFDWRQLK